MSKGMAAGALKLLSGAMALTGMMGGHAAAQSPGGLDEIIVVAQKREENLQEVPLAITALSEEFIEKSSVDNVEDLALFTPGLLVGNQDRSTGTANLILRGVTTSVAGVGVDPNVAIYIDGVYVARPSAFLSEYFDFSRIEVLKGPQGTLYGRNATGGAINYITKGPSRTPEFSAKATFGDNDRLIGEAVAGGPLGKSVSGRLAVLYHSESDYVERQQPGPFTIPGSFFSPAAIVSRKHEDAADAWGVRGSLQFDLSPTFNLRLSADHLDDDAHKYLFVKPRQRSGRTIMVAGVPFPAPTRAVADTFSVVNDTQPVATYTESGMSMTATYTPDAPYTIRSVTGYRELESFRIADIDASEVPYIRNTSFEDSSWWTQEVQIASASDSPFEWMIGAFYLRQDSKQIISFGSPLAASLVPGYNAPTNDAEITTDAYALFGQTSYRLDKWRFNLGARFSDETKDHFIRASDISQFPSNPLVVLPLDSVEESWDAFTYSAGADYFANDDLMLFSRISRGFKSGGFNSIVGTSDSDQGPFDPEYIWAYEAGFKWDATSAFRSNLSLFYYDYQDLQVSAVFPGQIITDNAAAATAYGGELELTWAPTPNFSLMWGGGYLNFEYEDYRNAQNAQTGGADDASGNRAAYAPKFTSSVVADYNHGLGALGRLNWRAEWRYQTKTYFDAFESENLAQDGYHLVNLGLTWSDKSDRVSVAARLENALDEEYRYASYFAQETGILDYYAPPQTFQVRLAVRN